MNRFFAFAIVLLSGLCSLVFAEGKVFNKDYSGIKSIEATIETHEGKIVLELNFKEAPNTVANFVDLASKGFYDGLIFHRVIPGFMIQGGDPEGTGMGGPGWHIKGEFAANGWDNPIAHKRGVISMARAQDPNSAGSQFFIMHGDASYLDGQYAAFGKVVRGIEVVDKIAGVPTSRWNNRPYEDQVIDTIRIVEE